MDSIGLNDKLDQCNQIARLIIQNLAISNNQNLPNSIEMWNGKILPNLFTLNLTLQRELYALPIIFLFQKYYQASVKKCETITIVVSGCRHSSVDSAAPAILPP